MWPRYVIKQEDFETAAQSLMQTPLVGLVDVYDESMLVFEEALREIFPAIDLSYIKQNTGRDQEGDLNERIEKVMKDLGPDVGKILLDNNKYDLFLYEKARSLLTERMGAIDDFSGKLDNFLKRCAALVKDNVGGSFGIRKMSRFLNGAFR